MSYSIEYDPEKNRIYPLPAVKKPKWLLFFLAAVIVLLTLQMFDRNQRVIKLLLPGNSEITAAAFSAMVDDIREGTAVGEAVTSFCLEIIHNG